MNTRSMPAPGSSTKDASDAAADTTSLHTATSRSNETIVAEDQSMFFLEMHPLAPISVVLLHGLFSSHLEWKHVWTKLPEYHLLIPDLPCHSKSRRLRKKQDFSLSLCADLVARMIRKHAHDGRAHVVGLSIGGFVAMELVRRHPDVVKDAFVLGAWPVKRKLLSIVQHPRLVYAGLWSMLHTGGLFLLRVSGYTGERQDAEMLKEIKRNGSSRLAKAAFSDVLEWQDAELVEVGKQDMRICMVGAGKEEDVKSACDAAKVLKQQSRGGEGGDTRAYFIRDAIHTWNVQSPAVFAKGIQCWIERQNLPKEYEEMPIL